MTKSLLSSAVPILLAALFFAATWLPTLDADFRPLANPFAEQAAQA